MRRKISILLLVSSLLITGVINVHGQVSYFVDQEITLNVESVDGNNYAWGVFLDEHGLVSADQAIYEFISSAEQPETTLKIKSEGEYYVVLFETNPLGCSTGRVLRIEVISNNLKFAVGNADSESCYEASGNDFIVALRFQDNEGKPLGQEHFPIDVTFSVDGEQQPSQKISYFKQELEIGSSLYAIQSNQNTSMLVSLDEATDSKNIKIRPEKEEDS